MFNFKRLGGKNRLAVYDIVPAAPPPTPGPPPPPEQETCSTWQGTCGINREATGSAVGGKCKGYKCTPQDCCRQKCSAAKCGASLWPLPPKSRRIAPTDWRTVDRTTVRASRNA